MFDELHFHKFQLKNADFITHGGLSEFNLASTPIISVLEKFK